jgi:hypothetical protein
MQNIVKSAVTAAGAACLAFALFGSAVASATSSHESNTDVKVSTTPPQMELSASTGEQIRSTGTQGVFSNADQCTESSTTTKVACITPSSEAAPQLKAK